ncbi:VanZ family protein [Pararhizobium capsulatum DSM 1112]|uniref:VanZ family protein n=1 Tax=Pararhizobium capsulatum DSM 1112 TaxID=1121113 RepID=A0ABU0BUQ5_9HYPH|nr:VanZ family protein [Pararhizobium capsulatum]MDQ0321975.1 VanZ family protein [Pararhizobium capsulatum DSM 1112]
MTKSFFKIFSWLLIAAVVFVTISPIGLRPHTLITVSFDRALAFALIGCAFALGYPNRWLSLCVFLIVAAFGIEVMQYWAPTRHPHFADASVKAAGAIFGMVIGKAALIIRRQKLTRTA